jgi:hypothetical protein
LETTVVEEPDDLKFAIFLSKSNQNGAPRETARVVINRPKTFFIQPMKSEGNAPHPSGKPLFWSKSLAWRRDETEPD